MKVLVVKPHLPIPPHQGTRRVTINLLRDLRSAFDVAYLTMLERREEAALVPELESMGVRVRARLMPNRRSPAHRVGYRLYSEAGAWATGLPRECYYATPRCFARELERWTREERFDIVLLEYWKLGRLVPFVAAGRPVVLAHDAEFVKRDRRRVLLGRSPMDRIHAWRLIREASHEIAALRRCETILTLTEQDRRDIREALGPAFGGDVRVLPVGVDAPPPSRRTEPDPDTVGFLGSFKGDFNVDAVQHLLSEVWPAVRARRPTARLLVAGADVPSRLRGRDGRDGVTFLGYVEDRAEFIRRLGVFVVPLRFGGGLRIRLLEAMSAGAAVVSTSVGAAGLELTAGEHFVLADDPAEFAGAIVRLLADPPLRRRLVESGRRLARERYGPEDVRRRTVELFQELAASRVAA